jgi:adenylate kinase
LKNIIFIGGIHGSGKGVICEKITSKFEIIHLTASEVLKWTEISEQNVKEVSNIQNTQHRLIDNLHKIIRSENKYLLDGHYCLLNKDGIPEKIPLETFREISPSKLVLIVASPQEIKTRLESRDSKIYALELIEDFQNLEIGFAKEISQALKIPLFIFDSLSAEYNDIFNFLS